MEEESDIDYTIKLLIVGDSSVGKTNFIFRLIEDKFNPNYMTTTGIDLKTINIEIDNKKIRVQLWDTAGQEKYKAITKNLFLKVQGTLVVFDITNDDSFVSSKSWVSSLKDECGRQMQIILIGNKSDLEDKRVVSREEASKYAEEEIDRRNRIKDETLLTKKKLLKYRGLPENHHDHYFKDLFFELILIPP